MMIHFEAPTNERQNQVSRVFGEFVRILTGTARATFKLVSIEHFVMPAIRLGQYQIVYNKRGVPVAYMCWAFLSDEVCNEYLSGSDRLLHISEWNEGANLWVMDIVSPYGFTRELLSIFKKKISTDRILYGRRYVGDRSVIKRINYVRRGP